MDQICNNWAMDDSELIKYFMKRTDQRLEQMDQKIDSLLEFKWKVFGAIIVVSTLVNIIVAFASK